ncbi:MAG TPA: T9SS type A sorting domain-containing protein [Flavipsychrobacter sp.]|nr:T9SS type A sorting domain-containing protein [Flavipsychrobacter sp.]
MQKVLLTFAAIVFFFSFTNAQPWSKIYFPNTPGSNYAIYCYDSIDGGLMGDYLQSSFETKLTRFNEQGDTIWTQDMDDGGLTVLYSYGIDRLTSGDYIIASLAYDNFIDYHTLFNRYSSSGTLTAQFTKPSQQASSPQAYAALNGGYFVMTKNDSTYTYLDQNQNIIYNNIARSYISRYDANNNLIWEHSRIDSFLNLPQYWSGIGGIEPLHASLFNDGGLVFTRNIDTIPYTLQGYKNDVLERVDENGNLLWSVDLHSALNIPAGVHIHGDKPFVTSDSCVVLTAYKEDAGTQMQIGGQLLLKFNAAGILLGQLSFGIHQFVAHGTELKSGNYIFYASLQDTFNSSNYVEGIVLYDENLNFLSFHPEPFSHFGFGNGFIANTYGGALYAVGATTHDHINVFNFDSLLNIYPALLPGSLNLDLNQNCQFNTGDSKITYSPVKLTDGSNNDLFAFSNANGQYLADVPLGTYSVTQPVPQNKQVFCPVSGYNYNFSAPGTYSVSDFYSGYIPNLNDIQVAFYPATFVPGFNTTMQVLVNNVGSTIADSTLVLNIDNNLQFISSVPVPISVSGSTLTFDVSSLQPDSSFAVAVEVHVPQTVPLGTLLAFDAYAGLNNDVNQGNNYDVLGSVVVGSFDPNDKTVNRPTICAPDADFIYRVRFQNTGTYYAKNVVVVDTISSLLDMSTFKLLNADPFMPEVSWSVGGKLTFNFADIYLPDSNTDEPGSHGQFIYSIKPKNTVSYGDSIKNTAHIYFDFNEAVVTNTTLNIIGWPNSVKGQVLMGSALLYPNPATTQLTVETSDYDSYTITNYLGAVVSAGKLSSRTTHLPIRGFIPGIYFIELAGRSGATTYKFQKL